METTLNSRMAENIGQVHEADAQLTVDTLNRRDKCNDWRIDTSDFLYVPDETDEMANNPCPRMDGYVWVTRTPKLIKN